MPADLVRQSHRPFVERLWPGPSGWVVVVGLAGMLTICFIPVRTSLALAVGAVGLVAASAFALWTSPRVEVAAGELRAGAARIPITLLGLAQVLDRESTRTELGPALDARAYLCLRSWIGTAVRVEVADPEDPTPYWIVSTRRPVDLVEALTRASATDG